MDRLSIELLIFTVALIIAYFTWKANVSQKNLSEEDLRHKNFKKYFAAKQKLDDYIQKIISGNIRSNDNRQFNNDTKEFEFTFDKDINNYLSKIKSFGGKLADLNNNIQMLFYPGITQDDMEKRRDYMKEKTKYLQSAFELKSELSNIFDPFLKLYK